MTISKLDAFKLAARLVVGAGTTTITNSIIRNNVVPTNIWQQVSVGVASVVVGSMASSATRSHTDTQIDGIVEALKTASAKAHETTDPAVA